MNSEQLQQPQIDRPLWERQAWDTDASFDRFQKYYLPQLPPRSLPKAYRTYLEEKGKKPEGSQQDVQPNGHWLNWFYAKNSSGVPIPGSVGWQARARAYDDYVWAERREWHKRQSWEIVEQGFRQVRDMIAHPLIRQRVTQVDADGRPVTYIIEPTNWRKRDAAGSFQIYDRIARLDLGEPTDRTAVSGTADYSQISDDQLNDRINRLMARSGPAGERGITSPSFREGEPAESDHESEFEEG